MARNVKPIAKQYRRLGLTLGVNNSKSRAIAKRPYAPGQHGPDSGRQKVTEYGRQLREKQKAKLVYGILERQFRKYYETAMKKKGNTGILLVQTLERRLDNVVYRLFCDSRSQARQLVNHGHLFVNGKKVDIVSYETRIGEVISFNDGFKKSKLYDELSKKWEKKEIPGWLSLDKVQVAGKVIVLPGEEDFEKVFDPAAIIEFYSR
ncbi:MAG: 30S ribosomal protein S4 [bacterium]